MNGPLIDAAKKILKRKYGVECTEPFAGVDRFRRTTGNSVAQVDLESWRKSSAYKLRLSGFCYDNDETYEGESKVKMTELTNPTDVAELIDEQLSKVETNLAIIVKMHRPYSKKKRILNFGEAKELLESAGFSVISEENVQLSDEFRTAWNGIMHAMSDFTNWNRVVMWYAWDKYEKKATSLSEAYARGQYSLHEIIEKMKSAGMQWYRDLFSEIDAILTKNHLEVTSDRGKFSYGDKSYKIVPVCNSVSSACSFEIRENSDTNTPQIHSEDDVFKRTPFIENPVDALDVLETLMEKSFNTELGEAKEVLKNAGFLVEYIDHVSEPSTFGKSEYTVDYNWWPSDKSDYWVNRQDTVWLENPDDEDEIIEALSDILGEGSPEVEILSVK